MSGWVPPARTGVPLPGLEYPPGPDLGNTKPGQDGVTPGHVKMGYPFQPGQGYPQDKTTERVLSCYQFSSGYM